MIYLHSYVMYYEMTLTMQLELRAVAFYEPDAPGGQAECHTVTVDGLFDRMKALSWEGDDSLSEKMRYIAVHHSDMARDVHDRDFTGRFKKNSVRITLTTTQHS